MFLFYFRRGFTLEEALQMAYADDLDVEGIYIEPPDTNELIDKDSADEDNGGMVDNLPASQLRAPAELQVRNSNEKDFAMEKIDATKVNWDKAGDLEATARPFPASSYEGYSNCTPFELFEKFFDEELIELLVTESTRNFEKIRRYTNSR
uniref:Uncharacterized protein LOC114347369 n=1 Tax=Diabrotica virgifera virgifera TaxID=50390 RepID=A0A6P7H5R1_DIAVI